MTRLITGCVLCLFAFATCVHAGETWTQNSFADFRQGTFLDAGSNAYVSAKGRIQIISRWDLNNDGFLDVIMPAGHGQTEKEDTYVYLNNGGDIDARLLIRVPANGSMDGVVRDFNKDGLNDLAVCNGDNGINSRTNTYVYFGSKDGLSAKNRITLPSHDSRSIAAGDFNGDGLLDIAIACSWEGGTLQKPDERVFSFVYWNSPDGFKPENRSEFSFNNRGADAVCAGDLDADGKDDLIMTADKIYIYYGRDNAVKDPAKCVQIPGGGSSIAIGDFNKDGIKDLALCGGSEIRVLMGTKSGFADRPIVLKGDNARKVAVADFDGDGLDDIALANYCTGNDAGKSYIYYSDGKDFSSRKVLEIPTFGAVAVSAGDINGDGKPELVVSNQRINYYHALQSAVFWNVDGKFDFAKRTQLDTQGTTSNCIGDINNDGKPDVIFFNLEGYYRDGPAYTRIYWGDGTRNYTPARAFEILPTHYVTGIGHADLDDDGDVELIINQGRYLNGLPFDHAVPTIICWNGPDGLNVRSNLTLDNPSGGGTKILDFNRDGYLDLLLGGSVTLDNGPHTGKPSMPIFLGSANGFHHTDKMYVPLPQLTGLRVALAMDLNKDGWIDLAAQIATGKVRIWYGSADGYSEQHIKDIDLGRDDALMYINAADLNKDGWLDMVMPCRQIGHDSEVTSFIYFGSPDGFSNAHRTEVATNGPYDLAIADFDKDGWLDLFMNSYKGNETRNHPSYIYWGSPTGFAARPRTELPTFASSGAEAADFDGDGWLDIYSANHREDGFTDKPGPHRHQTSSMIYWGGPKGFSPEQRLLIPSYGPHPLNIRDVGNSYDRGLYEDYFSCSHQVPATQVPAKINWVADTPFGTSVKFQVRVADARESLEQAKWMGPHGSDNWFTTPGSTISNAKGQWIQYRARLVTPNGAGTPYLTSVSIEFQ